jgi:hypothetical protein
LAAVTSAADTLVADPRISIRSAADMLSSAMA